VQINNPRGFRESDASPALTRLVEAIEQMTARLISIDEGITELVKQQHGFLRELGPAFHVIEMIQKSASAIDTNIHTLTDPQHLPLGESVFEVRKSLGRISTQLDALAHEIQRLPRA